MNRSAFDALRRGFDSAVANWPLILLRFAEQACMTLFAIASVFVLILPMFVATGLRRPKTFDEIADVVPLLLEHWTIFLWLGGLALVLTAIWVVVHSFVQAGAARVLIDADRAAGPELEGNRLRYRTFTVEQFVAGAREGFWTVFWILNFTWGVAGLILLIPLLPTLAAVLLVDSERIGILIFTGCFGLFLSALLFVVVAFVTAVWTQKAIVIALDRRGGQTKAGTRNALRVAWLDVRRDFGRHFLVAMVMFAVSVGISGITGSISVPYTFEPKFTAIVIAPLYFVASLIDMSISSAIAIWFLASFAALLPKESA